MAEIIRMSVAGMIIEQRIAMDVMKTDPARKVNSPVAAHLSSR